MSSLKIFFISACLLFISEVSLAQEKITYYLSINKVEGKRLVGSIASITNKGITIAAKQRKQEPILTLVPFEEIDKLLLHKNRKNIGVLLFGAAGVVGSVAYGLDQSDGNVAAAVIAGGTIATVGISAIIYRIANPPIIKLKRSNDTIDYNSVNEALKVYISR